MLNTPLSHEIQYRSMHINVWDNGNDLFQTNKMGRTCRLRSTRSLPSHSYAEKVNYWGIEILFNSEKNHRISKRRGQSHSFTFFTFVLQCRLQCDLYSIDWVSIHLVCQFTNLKFVTFGILMRIRWILFHRDTISQFPVSLHSYVSLFQCYIPSLRY